MGRRQSVYVVRKIPTDGGESPNRTVPQVTVEIRVHYPPETPLSKVSDILHTAAHAAEDQMFENV